MVATKTSWWGWRCVAAVAAMIAVAGAAFYLWLIAQQRSDGPAWWFVTGLGAAILLGGYGTLQEAPRRGAALAGGAILIALGILGILSVGLPLLGAGLLFWVAAARQSGRRSLDQPASNPRSR